MAHVVIFGIAYAVTLVIWLIVVLIYNKVIESIDFGSLPRFVLKSLLIVAVVVPVIFYVPFGGYLSFAVWGIGLMIIFHMDVWEAKMLVMLIWAVNFAASIMLFRMAAGFAKMG